MKRQYDRLMRERDTARLKGRLLQKQLEAAQRELEAICVMLEKQKIRNKKEIAYLLSSSDSHSLDRIRSTESTRTASNGKSCWEATLRQGREDGGQSTVGCR